MNILYRDGVCTSPKDVAFCAFLNMSELRGVICNHVIRKLYPNMILNQLIYLISSTIAQGI